MKLAVACVYFYGADSEWILDLQLRYIASTLAGYDYRVYAAANRLEPRLLRKLASTPGVRVLPLPGYDGRESREHAFYLDQLLRAAAADGCTHLAAVDSDSFPIVAGWPHILLREMGPDIRFAAVLRAENGDTHLPHPCGYFMTSSFLQERRPALLPDDSELASEPFRAFLKATQQRVDTGIGYGFSLWQSRERWLQLRRSNRHNPHFLMAGIYGGIFFHLGASGRRPDFARDHLRRPSLRLAKRFRDVPVLWRLAARIEDRYMASNQLEYRAIAESLKAAPERFLAALGSLPAMDVVRVKCR